MTSSAGASTTPVSGITGHNAVVTGAAGGIGSAVVEALRSAGGIVDGWDLQAGRGCRAVDVTDRAAVADAWRAAETELGAIDIVVAAAGVLSDDWDRCMSVNAGGVRNVLDVAVAAMTNRTHGAAVVVSSNAATTPRIAMAPYAASKAAASAYTKSVALAAAAHDVRVNIVSPGSTDTAMLRGMWHSDTDAETVLTGDPEQFRLGIPLRRIATPAAVAASVVFLASDAARHVTMHDLRVDGGATLDM